MAIRKKMLEASGAPDWYKDAIIYELHVRSFYDSNQDGIGDFRGLTQKLDYLHDLGITAIWLLPFFPSPLRDDGYDISDYRNINPAYGNLSDFSKFIREAHRRQLRVITELVINHTSDQHPWFQRARRASPGSAMRNFYVWSETPEKYTEARIIFRDFESSNWSWDSVAKAYFWHRFYAHQPDLNFDSPLVRRAILRLLDFWFNLGVDGLRLDAVPYLFEREGTDCENLRETHAFLKELRRHIDRNFKDRMLLAEANQWPEDAAAYFGDGDECHMAFHFPIMPRLFIALRMEDRFPIVESLEQTPQIPPNCQWATFLRNHDELTLEMVTDEERDYMYRVYAQDRQARINLGIRRRLAPLMGNNRRKIELMNSLLFSLPGTPVLYYGDEIGMGDNIFLGDRNGVRTPMQWCADRNAGFSRANPQGLYLPPIIDQEYHYETVNVEIQQNNPGSLLWWTKRMIALRRNFKAFGRGSIEFLFPDNRKVLAFIRGYEQENILVVANLSRTVQFVELNLSQFKGMMLITPYGRVEFPMIKEAPYMLSLGPYGFMWFSIEQPTGDQMPTYSMKKEDLPSIDISGQWKTLLEKKSRSKLERLLPGFFARQRWFRSKAKSIREAVIREIIWSEASRADTCLTMVDVEYAEGDTDTYLLPMAFAADDRAKVLLETVSSAVIARVAIKNGEKTGVLYDASVDPNFGRKLLKLIENRRTLTGINGNLVGNRPKSSRAIYAKKFNDISIMAAEQTNTSIRFEDDFILKLYRKLEEGINSEFEIGRFLMAKGFSHVPSFAGELQYLPNPGSRKEPTAIAALHGWVPNHGDAWTYTLDTLSRYFEEMAARRPAAEIIAIPNVSLLDLTFEDIPNVCYELIGSYLESVRLLGERTAQLHLILASEEYDPNFLPEKFTPFHQRSVYQSMLNLTAQVFAALKQHLKHLTGPVKEEASAVLERQGEVRERFKSWLNMKITAVQIRCHGDYHLGQVLYTGKDFVIMDFEGEPARSISERRLKRSPLRDVVGMLRSFHYVANTAMFAHANVGSPSEREFLDSGAMFWYEWVSVAFLKSYLETAQGAAFIPKSQEELRTLMDVFMLEKVVYELGYELNNRPDWVKIPLQGIRHVLS